MNEILGESDHLLRSYEHGGYWCTGCSWTGTLREFKSHIRYVRAIRAQRRAGNATEQGEVDRSDRLGDRAS